MSRLIHRPHIAFTQLGRSLAATGILLYTLLGAAPVLFAANPSPEKVMDTVTSAIAIEKAGQERGRQWEEAQARMLEEIRQARLEAAWYALQVETFTRYVETARQRVTMQLQTQKELERMEAELEGELLLATQALEKLVAQDIPFLPEERQRRLDFLQKTLGDYELASAEKLRRVLEAMQAEYSYGNTVDLSPGIISVPAQSGKEPSSQSVTIVRAGRVGLYALAPDSSRAWIWTREHGFRPLTETETGELARVTPMLEAKSVRFLPALPFAAPLSDSVISYPAPEQPMNARPNSTEVKS